MARARGVFSSIGEGCACRRDVRVNYRGYTGEVALHLTISLGMTKHGFRLIASLSYHNSTHINM